MYGCFKGPDPDGWSPAGDTFEQRLAHGVEGIPLIAMCGSWEERSHEKSGVKLG
jgi:hypothetical protein